MVQLSFAVSPPCPAPPAISAASSWVAPETAEATIDSRSRAPVLKLNSPESVTYPRVQIFEYLREGRGQPEVGLPASKVYPHLFGHLDHALASNTSGDEPDTLFERVESLRSNSNLDGVS